MQKPANRILSALLVLIMVLSMLPATVFATGETDIFQGWSLTLGDNIGVNFYLEKEAADYTVNVAVAGNTAAYQATETDDSYVVTVNVAAAQMTDKITLSVLNGETQVHTGEYSVRQYAETLLTGEYDSEVKEMVKEMLNYGAAAQTYFQYNTETLANAGYEIEATASIPTEVPEVTVEDNLAGIGLYGLSLVFENKTAVRFYYTVSGDINTYTFKVGETTCDVEEKNGLYYVEVGGINPQDITNDITVVASKGEDTLSVTYSPMNYIVRKYNNANSSVALKNLVKSLYSYHLEAKEYQRYLAIVPISTMSLATQYGANGLDLNDAGNVKNIYASADVNDAPGGDWSYEYTPVEAAGLQLIRGGETYNVGIPGSGTIVKFGDAGYCIKLEAWTVANSMLPLQENDVLVIEGRYNLTGDSSVVVDFDKTYIHYNGTGVEFSAEMPVLPTTVQGSALSNHDSNGWQSNGVYFKLEENAAPFDGWSVEYSPAASENLKLIRGGETYNIGFPGRGTIVKYNATDYFLKMEWNVGEYAPMQDGDILIVEGGFVNSASKVTLNLPKTYIYANGANVEISTEMPTLPTTIEGGVMMKVDGYGWTGGTGSLIFKMDNAAPNGGYAPTSAANVKLIRNGETYDVAYVGQNVINKSNDTWYTLEFWTIVDYKPMLANDILVIEGAFAQNSTKTTLNISKTYVLLNADGSASFSTEMPSLSTMIDAGMMGAHSDKGWTSSAEAAGNLHFAMADNDAPSGYYRPAAASNVKLIRNGVTYDVGHNLRDTIAKENNAQYIFEFWTIADHKPMVANDILIVEGEFVQASSNTILNITKTYILLKADGTATFSAEMPNLGTYVEGGLLTGNDMGWNGDGIYFSMNENEAPFNTDWSLRYKPASSDVIKLLRDGTTTNIANKDAETLVKYSETNCVLATWMFGSYGLKAGDILIVEGEFLYAAENVTLNVQKSYILLNADGSVTISATEPVPTTEVDCGVMSEHADGSASEIYFSLAENSIPVDEELLYPYAGTVQLVNGTAVSSVNVNIYKLDADMYYLELDGAELTNGSYLIVEGAFENADNGYIMNISKTYVLAEDDALVYSESAPVLATEYALTGLTNHPNGWNADGIYITHDAHNATYNSDWSVEYKPVSADVIKLVRDGQTYNIGQPVSGTLVVYDPANMLFKTAAWTIQGGVLPFVDGDKIIIEGKFKHEGSGDILVVEKTVIYVNGTSLVFNPIEGSNLGDHSNGLNGNGEGIYATMEANAAPYSGWSIEYAPLTENAYYVIRGGEQINIGMPGRGTLVKYGDTNYYLKMNSWCTNNFAYTTDDIFVIEGFWKQNTQGSAIMKIEKTYLYYDGTAWVFATELPSIINAGLMQTHSNGMSGSGIYFKLDANDAPYDGWNIEYKQTSVDNIKLIRDGETISIGIVDRPLFVKYGETDYYLKLEKWTIGEYGVNGGTTPITTDDVIIIEGSFVYDNVTLQITKSYVYYDGSAWVCSDTAPTQKNVVDVVELGSHGNGWTTGGFYFTAAANDAPYDGWSLRYKPVSADVIKCISGDTTTNVGNTGGETIVKYSETEYYVEGWAIGSANLVAGNTFVIEGRFYNAANDVYIDVEKTYITLNADGSTTVITDSAKYINAGAMSAYAVQNWFNTNYNALYFVLDSNIAPANTDWSVRYTPKDAANIKLIRGGNTINIANTGAETIVKIQDGLYALALDNWWWNAYAPIQDGDVLIVEGEFTNASNGYTLNISKTYITFVSKESDNVVFSTAADTEFGEVLLPNTTDTLTIGVWNGSYHVFEDKQLRELQAAGITKIMGIDTQWIGTTDVNAWLDRVYSYGISVIFDLRSWDGETVPSYASHPAVIGFLMYDEPCATEFDNLAALKAEFDAVMPAGKLFYVNLFPSCAAGTSLVGSIDWTLGRRDYNTYYVQKFLDKVGIEVLSWDNYSLLNGNGIRTDYFYNFEVMASKNVPLWYTMLSAGHSTTSTSYATPTAEELRWQMAVALTYGVQNIDHYTYVSHESDYSCMVEYETWEPTDLYYDIKAVDNEFLAWDNIYMAYDWQGVGFVDVGDANAMLTKLNNEITLTNYGLAAIGSTNQDILVGVFDHNGDKAYMVTNIGTPNSTTVGDGKGYVTGDTTVTLTLGAGSYKCVAVIDQGVISYVAVNADNTVSIDVEAYEGVFVIPVRN